MRKIFTLFFCAASLATGLAQQESYFTNPVIHGDVADPSIIRIDQTYYITGTSSEWAPYYPVFTSTDLVNWQQTGHVFDEKPEWTKSSFWAPEWYQHKGKVYVYYTARKQSDNISCIGLRPGGRVWEGSDRRIYLGGQRQTLHQLEGLWIG